MQSSKYSLPLLGILVMMLSLCSGLALKIIIEKDQSNANSQEHVVTNTTHKQSLHIATDTNILTTTQSTSHPVYKVIEKGSFNTWQKVHLYQAATVGADTLSLIYQLPLQDCTFTMSYLQASGLLNDASVWLGEVSSNDAIRYEFMVDANSFELISLYQLKEAQHQWLRLIIPSFSQETQTRITQKLQVLQNTQYTLQTLSAEITTYTNQMTDLSMQMGLKGLEMLGKTPKEIEQIAQEMEGIAAQMDDVGQQMDDLDGQLNRLKDEQRLNEKKISQLSNELTNEVKQYIHKEVQKAQTSHTYDAYLTLAHNILVTLNASTTLIPQVYMPCLYNEEEAVIIQVPQEDGSSIWLIFSTSSSQLLTYYVANEAFELNTLDALLNLLIK